MRILFRNMGQAQLVLKTCMRVLKEDFGFPPETQLSSQRLRNAFCVGLGYSSYSELQKLMEHPLGDSWEEPEEEDFREALSLAFEKAYELLASEAIIGPYDEDAPIDTSAKAVEKIKKAMIPSAAAGELEFNGVALLSLYESGRCEPKDLPQLLDDAEEEFSGAVQLQPRMVDAHHALARIAFKRKDFEASRKHASTALLLCVGALETDAPDAFDWGSDASTLSYLHIRHTLGMTLWSLGKNGDARNEFSEILKRDKSDRFHVRDVLTQIQAA